MKFVIIGLILMLALLLFLGSATAKTEDPEEVGEDRDMPDLSPGLWVFVGALIAGVFGFMFLIGSSTLEKRNVEPLMKDNSAMLSMIQILNEQLNMPKSELREVVLTELKERHDREKTAISKSWGEQFSELQEQHDSTLTDLASEAQSEVREMGNQIRDLERKLKGMELKVKTTEEIQEEIYEEVREESENKLKEKYKQKGRDLKASYKSKEYSLDIKDMEIGRREKVVDSLEKKIESLTEEIEKITTDFERNKQSEKYYKKKSSFLISAINY